MSKGNTAWRKLSDTPRALAPRVQVSVVAVMRGGFGVLPEKPRLCVKCKATEFVNVGCPKVWPVGTVVLTCSICGHTSGYVDGLLLMSRREAIRELRGRSWVVRRRAALEVADAHGIDQDVVMLALDNGMSMEEIVDALGSEVRP